MMERLRKLEATKAKGLRSQKDENGEDVDSAIGQIKGGIELTNCQVTEMEKETIENSFTLGQMRSHTRPQARVDGFVAYTKAMLLQLTQITISFAGARLTTEHIGFGSGQGKVHFFKRHRVQNRLKGPSSENRRSENGGSCCQVG